MGHETFDSGILKLHNLIKSIEPFVLTPPQINCEHFLSYLLIPMEDNTFQISIVHFNEDMDIVENKKLDSADFIQEHHGRSVECALANLSDAVNDFIKVENEVKKNNERLEKVSLIIESVFEDINDHQTRALCRKAVQKLMDNDLLK